MEVGHKMLVAVVAYRGDERCIDMDMTSGGLVSTQTDKDPTPTTTSGGGGSRVAMGRHLGQVGVERLWVVHVTSAGHWGAHTDTQADR